MDPNLLQMMFNHQVTLDRATNRGERPITVNQFDRYLNELGLQLPPIETFSATAVSAYERFMIRESNNSRGGSLSFLASLAGTKLDTTSDLDLRELAKRMGISGLKVLAVDELTGLKASPGNYIINMDDSTGPGTHWVALYSGPKQRYTIYFDPFGETADPRTIKFMKRMKGKKAIGFEEIAQDSNATSCGYWCLFFLNEMKKGVRPEQFLSRIINTDKQVNEEMLEDYFNKII